MQLGSFSTCSSICLLVNLTWWFCTKLTCSMYVNKSRYLIPWMIPSHPHLKLWYTWFSAVTCLLPLFSLGDSIQFPTPLSIFTFTTTVVMLVHLQSLTLPSIPLLSYHCPNLKLQSCHFLAWKPLMAPNYLLNREPNPLARTPGTS